METSRIRPRLLPTRLLDFIGLPIALTQVALYAFVPSIVVYLVAKPHNLAEVLALASCLVLLLVMGLVWWGRAVFSLEVGPEGIRFRRLFGHPRFLKWTEVQSVDKVTPGEVIVHGWLVEPFLSREPTLTLTATGHYRISWGAGWCYFPPRKPDEFEDLVSQYGLTAHNTRMEADAATPGEGEGRETE